MLLRQSMQSPPPSGFLSCSFRFRFAKGRTMRVGYSAASKEDLSPQRRVFKKYACFLLVTGTEHLLGGKHYSLHASSHFIYTLALYCKCCYYPHFIYKETKSPQIVTSLSHIVNEKGSHATEPRSVQLEKSILLTTHCQ